MIVHPLAAYLYRSGYMRWQEHCPLCLGQGIPARFLGTKFLLELPLLQLMIDLIAVLGHKILQRLWIDYGQFVTISNRPATSQIVKHDSRMKPNCESSAMIGIFFPHLLIHGICRERQNSYPLVISMKDTSGCGNLISIPVRMLFSQMKFQTSQKLSIGQQIITRRILAFLRIFK